MSNRANPQADHPKLDRLFLEIDRLGGLDDLVAMRAAWLELERELRRHLACEEASWIPRFAAGGHGDEARALEAAHDEFRTLLREVGEQLGEGSFDAALAATLSRSYRVHQIREDTTLYRWAREQDASGE